MEPILTLPYSEWLVADILKKSLPEREGYSIYAPLSRQQKGVDLLVARRAGGASRAVTLQVKYSRAYEAKHPNSAFRFTVWFRSFSVSELADFYVLASLFPNVTGRGTGAASSWWPPLTLLFTYREMADLLSSLRTRAGKPERMFYFSFNEPEHVFLTRGAPDQRDLSAFTLHERLPALRRQLGPA